MRRRVKDANRINILQINNKHLLVAIGNPLLYVVGQCQGETHNKDAYEVLYVFWRCFCCCSVAIDVNVRKV